MSKRDEDSRTLYCSFCGKSQHEVKKLIAGPTVFICDECVVLCLDIVVESGYRPAITLNDATKNVMREHAIATLLVKVSDVFLHHQQSRPLMEALAASMKHYDTLMAMAESAPQEEMKDITPQHTENGC